MTMSSRSKWNLYVYSVHVQGDLFMTRGNGMEQLELSVWTNNSQGVMWQIEYSDDTTMESKLW